jgi:hypothetical protein
MGAQMCSVRSVARPSPLSLLRRGRTGDVWQGAAMAETGEVRLSGRGAWLAGRTIHIFSLRVSATDFGPGGVGLDFCARSAARG